jgi:hypothetical protein
MTRHVILSASKSRDRLAMDRTSVRSYDEDGRLHVAVANISKANICPYRGNEIPGWQESGLDPQRIYQLLRSPDELAKAAPTFNNVPLLLGHVFVTADNHQPDLVVGATGSDAKFSAPYLTNSLVIWVKDAIDGVENGDQREISCAYHYTPDMTPGSYRGMKYDGVMRDIRANHVALVPEGRAGSDVIVGDSQLGLENAAMPKALNQKSAMLKGVLMAAICPRLAQDQKIDLTPVLSGVSATTWEAKKPVIAEWLIKNLAGKLAQDAKPEDVVSLLDTLDEDDGTVTSDDDVDTPAPDGERDEEANATDEEPEDDAWRALYMALCKRFGPEKKPAKDTPLPTPVPPALPAKAKDPDPVKSDKPAIGKPAMDTAIAAAVARARSETETATIARLRDIATAENAVRPYVGNLAVAYDSAEGVYRSALETMGVDIAGVTGLPAFKAILTARGVAATQDRVSHTGAMDALSAKGAVDFDKEFGGSRIRVLK